MASGQVQGVLGGPEVVQGEVLPLLSLVRVPGQVQGVSQEEQQAAQLEAQDGGGGVLGGGGQQLGMGGGGGYEQ